ncbi:MAG: hypothetical protein IPL28_00600 [Chloroflexi bacterium]|nr:hypothetical protein [Chloroflexota bacterium]
MSYDGTTQPNCSKSCGEAASATSATFLNLLGRSLSFGHFWGYGGHSSLCSMPLVVF